MSDKYGVLKKELEELIKTGELIESDVNNLDSSKKTMVNGKELEAGIAFRTLYQEWFTTAYAFIEQVLPARSPEFKGLYYPEKRKEINSLTYSIQDYILGITSSVDYMGKKYFNDTAIVAMRFKTQMHILRSAKQRFEKSLLDIRQLLQADLFDSELDICKELLEKGFLRAAGAVSGVVLEKHLSQISDSHKINISKKDPSINDYNELLKKSGVIEVPMWRFIQRLGDLRNLCDHDKKREPTKEEVDELIKGTEKIVKTLY